MAARRVLIHLQAGGVEKGIFGNLDLGTLKWPRQMMHFETAEAASWRVSVEAVALGGPVFEGAGSCVEKFAEWTVATAKDDVHARAMAGEIEAITRAAELHAGEMIGEIEQLASGENGGARCGVEAEEPHAGFVAGDDVGADVNLGKGREGGCGKSARTDVHHAERHDSDPGCAIERVGRKAGRKMRTQGFRADAVMDEGEIEPRHGDGPRASGQRPWTVIGRAEKVGDVHGVLA